MLRRVSLLDFRCHARSTLDLPPGVSVLAGPNGAGKTSFLEAIHFAARLRSFRTGQPRDLIRHGAPLFRVEVQGPDHHLAVGWSPAERSLQSGGLEIAQAADYWGRLPVVTVTSRDADLVRGTPGHRRQFFNAVLSQADRAHLLGLLRYRALLKQRQAMVHSPREPDPALWRVVSAQLIDTGRPLQAVRTRLARRLVRVASRFHARLSAGRERLELRVHEAPWERTWAEERRAGRVLAGLQRDTFDLLLGGRPVQKFASEGQQRTAALALRAAEIAVLTRRGGGGPLVLVDDVFGELDPARREALLGLLPHTVQAILTATPQPWVADLPPAITRLSLPG